MELELLCLSRVRDEYSSSCYASCRDISKRETFLVEKSVMFYIRMYSIFFLHESSQADIKFIVNAKEWRSLKKNWLLWYGLFSSVNHFISLMFYNFCEMRINSRFVRCTQLAVDYQLCKKLVLTYSLGSNPLRRCVRIIFNKVTLPVLHYYWTTGSHVVNPHFKSLVGDYSISVKVILYVWKAK